MYTAYCLTKHARFCKPGVGTFSWRHLLFVSRKSSRKLLGENWWGSRQLRMLTWFSVIWSLFQFLVIIDYFGGKKHIESTMFCHTLARQTCEILRARDCDLFATIYLIYLSENYSKTIEGQLAGFLSVENVDLVQSNLKSVSILVTIDYFLGKNI